MDNNYTKKHRAILLEFSNSFDISILEGIETKETPVKKANPYDLKQYVMLDGNISGKALSNALFPTYKTGFFLSHSHDDEDLAREVAHCLQTLGKSVFYDEDLWQSADELIMTLKSKATQKTCRCGTKYYDCGIFMKNASLAYVMLCTALQEVITKSHTFIFLGTTQSIYSRTNQTTLSPWLYFELKTINSILASEEMLKMANESIQLKIELPLALDYFEKVDIRTDQELKNWLMRLQ